MLADARAKTVGSLSDVALAASRAEKKVYAMRRSTIHVMENGEDKVRSVPTENGALRGEGAYGAPRAVTSREARTSSQAQAGEPPHLA